MVAEHWELSSSFIQMLSQSKLARSFTRFIKIGHIKESTLQTVLLLTAMIEVIYHVSGS